MTKSSTIVSTDRHEVHFAEKAINTEAVPLLAEAWFCLQRDGFTTPSSFPDWDSNVFWVKERGILTAKIDENTRECWVGLAYVRPEHRKSGVFQSLWKCVRVHAASKGCAGIGWGVVESNARMRKLSDRIGQLRTLTYGVKL